MYFKLDEKSLMDIVDKFTFDKNKTNIFYVDDDIGNLDYIISHMCHKDTFKSICMSAYCLYSYEADDHHTFTLDCGFTDKIEPAFPPEDMGDIVGDIVSTFNEEPACSVVIIHNSEVILFASHEEIQINKYNTIIYNDEEVKL